MFAGVTGSAVAGSFSITFDREMRTEDRSPVSVWDLEIEAHVAQELILSGAPGMQPPPMWGGGYRVMGNGARHGQQGNGSLSLRSVTLGGNATVEVGSSARHKCSLSKSILQTSDSRAATIDAFPVLVCVRVAPIIAAARRERPPFVLQVQAALLGAGS